MFRGLFSQFFALAFSITALSACTLIRGVALDQTVVSPSNGKYIKISAINKNVNQQSFGSVMIPSLSGSTVYFFAATGTGAKLFSTSDGVNVQQISNTNPGGPDVTWYNPPKYVGGKLFFTAFDPFGRIKFYMFDPVVGGMVTQPFVEINTTLKGKFLAPAQVPTTKVGALVQLGDDSYPGLFMPVAIGTKIYFAAYNGTQTEIYAYDTTVPGVANQISNVSVPDSGTSNKAPFILGVANGALQFAVDDGSGTNTYNSYSYTPGGAVVAGAALAIGTDIRESLPTAVLKGNTYYFAGSKNTSDNNLYSYVIGASSITQVSNIIGSNDQVSDIVVNGGTLNFSAMNSSNQRINYILSGTPLSVVADTNLCGATCALENAYIGTIGTKTLFLGTDSNGLTKYYTNDSNSGVTQVAFTINQYGDDAPIYLTDVNGILYFAANSGVDANLSPIMKVYRYVPDSDGPVLLSKTSGSDTTNDDPRDFFAANNTLYFTALNAGGFRKLYKVSNSTNAPVTTPIANINGAAPDVIGNYVLGGNGFTYFTNTDTNGNSKLFVSDPNSANPILPQNAISNTAGNGVDDQISSLTPVGNAMYFIAVDASNNWNLYKYTGSLVTTPVSHTCSTGCDAPGIQTVLDNTIYFIAVDDVAALADPMGMTPTYTRLYSDTPANVAQITAANALSNTGGGVVDDAVTFAYTAGGSVFFIASDNTATYRAFRYAGSVVQSADALTSLPPMPSDRDFQNALQNNSMVWLQGTEFVKNEPKSYFEQIIAPMRSLFSSLRTPEAVAAAPVQYAKMPFPLLGAIGTAVGAGGGVSYQKIDSGGTQTAAYYQTHDRSAVQYMRVCTLYGGKNFVRASGIAFNTGYYIPGTSICGVSATKPNGNGFGTTAFQSFGSVNVAYGVDGHTKIWSSPDNSTLFFASGLMRPGHEITESKLYVHDPVLHTILQISPHQGGNDMAGNVIVTATGKYMYFTMNTCGGNNAIIIPGATSSCSHVWAVAQ